MTEPLRVDSEDQFMELFTVPDDDIDTDAPALKPEDVGEPADHPSAVHGDFHSRPGLGDQ